MLGTSELRDHHQAKRQEMTISIVIPAFNRARFIRAAIDSALNQSERADELIVVDDGSTDETPRILASYGDRLRVIEIDNNGAGPSRPRNVGIRAATSSHLMFLDSDDRLEPTAVARCKEVIRHAPDVALVCTNFYTGCIADGELNGPVKNEAQVVHSLKSTAIAPGEYWIDRHVAYRAYCRGVFIKTNASTVPREVVTAIGGFDEKLRTANDFDFFLRVLSQGDMVYIDEPLHTVVRHRENISSANIDGLFRDYVYRNYIHVLRKQQHSARDRVTTGVILQGIQEWLLGLAYGYRGKGRTIDAIKTYVEYGRSGGSLTKTLRGIAGVLVGSAKN